jgi:hypothetical protein
MHYTGITVRAQRRTGQNIDFTRVVLANSLDKQS